MSGRKRKTHEQFLKDISSVNKNIKILGQYKNSNTKILCECKLDNTQWMVTPTHLLSGRGCPTCGRKKAILHIKKTHEEFLSEMDEINPNIDIISKYLTDNQHVICKCKKDGYVWKSTPSNLLRGKGCPVCTNHKVLAGVNDFATLRPELVQYFKNPNIAKTISLHSRKKIECICPKCKHTDYISANLLTVNNGYSCPLCSDGISYPNKFSRAFLSQLPVNNLQFEWNPEWAFNYRYDNYFEYNGKSYVLEMDGGFHYMDNPFNGESKDVVKERDNEKDFLAKNHDVNIIRIDSRKSTKEYLSFNILHSDLNTIFDLSNINWDECDLYAKSSIFIKVCKTFNEEKLDSKSLAKKFNISTNTVVKYLNAGTNLNLCNYIPRDSKKKAVAIYDSDRHLLFNCNSISECSSLLQEKFNKKFHRSYIREACLGIRTLYNDLYFEFIL